MAVTIHRAHRPGSEEIVRRRAAGGKCCTPGCKEAVLEGGRFCAPHQEQLDRIRAELDGESESGENRRRWRARTTRGMKEIGTGRS
jgi:hypothetical protein